MKVLLFNDTDYTWKRHAAGRGPDEIAPGTGATIILYCTTANVFVKVWAGMFLVRGTSDEQFATDLGAVIGDQAECT